MHNSFNQLEPQSLADAFIKHPPVTFKVNNPSDFLPFFTTNFDLLTTLETPLKKRIESLWAYRYWGRLLQLKTCFIGTTVTEYTSLTPTLNVTDLTRRLKQYANKQSLTIIKDLPLNSPLLSPQENSYSTAFMATAEQAGFLAVEGQALAYVPINFDSQDEYFTRFSKNRRKDLKRKLKSLEALKVDMHPTGSPLFTDKTFRAELYALFLNVYNQSEIHFDLLPAEFFDEILQNKESGGRIFLYWKEDILLGYNICYEFQGNLIDKYIGLNYPLCLSYNLYFVSWFVNLNYAREHQLKFYIAGWTDPEVKAQLGASFTFTRHLVWIKQPVLRFILKKLRRFFETDTQWHENQGKIKNNE